MDEILARDGLELAFVWNRSLDRVSERIDEKYILRDLAGFASR